MKRRVSRRGATCQRDRRGNLMFRQVVSTLFFCPIFNLINSQLTVLIYIKHYVSENYKIRIDCQPKRQNGEQRPFKKRGESEKPNE